MLISKQWLSEFVKLPSDVSDSDLAKTITRSTVEVERYKNMAEGLDGVVVGEMLEFSKHPNADKLNVAKVDIGRAEPLNLIFGQMVEMHAGDRIPVAVAPTVLPTGIKIEAKNLRGVRSEGMLCLEQELGMKEGGVSILYFPNTPPGTPLAEALGFNDVIFEIEHKSLTNRPDLMGHYGMAREVAALYRAPLAKYGASALKGGKGVALSVDVEDAALCPRYMAVAMEGVKIASSPVWLRNRLLACGVRSINNVVDITNYVMLELGQPMHAFDAGAIGSKIVVRRAKNGETIECLDEETYTLDRETLLVTDGEKPIAIAGVMGAMESGVMDATTRIVFESANFNAVSVRKTSTKLALRSESSARFEKSLDPENCHLALCRAVELLKELCPYARVASAVVDEYPKPPKPVVISIVAEEVGTRLGTDIPAEDVKDILSRLGFSVAAPRGLKPNASRPLDITVPSWRATKDISIKEDVIEEVARMWGYDRIVPALPSFTIAPPAQDPVRVFARRARHALAALGVTEVYRYAFVSPEMLETLRFNQTPGFSTEDHLKLANPLAADRPYLAQSLIPNLFETVALNHRTFPTVSVFEIARVFQNGTQDEEDGQGGTLPAQPYHMALAYSAQGNDVPIVELRRHVETLLSELGLDVSFAPMEAVGWMHPARAAEIRANGKKYGILAEASPEVAAELGVDRRVAIAELNLSMLAREPANLRTFAPLPQFPDAKRDLAFIVDDAIAYGDIERALCVASPLLVTLELFDVYRGTGVEEEKKSIAVHLAFRDATKTLSSEEADAEVAKLAHVIKTSFRGTIRS